MTCTTHHHACDCREAKIAQLLIAAKALANSHRKCMALAEPKDPDDTDKWVDWVHYSFSGKNECEEIHRLWKELKWD